MDQGVAHDDILFSNRRVCHVDLGRLVGREIGPHPQLGGHVFDGPVWDLRGADDDACGSTLASGFCGDCFRLWAFDLCGCRDWGRCDQTDGGGGLVHAHRPRFCFVWTAYRDNVLFGPADQPDLPVVPVRGQQLGGLEVPRHAVEPASLRNRPAGDVLALSLNRIVTETERLSQRI